MFVVKNVLLVKSDIENFSRVYEDMTSQFPENELKSYDKFVELLNSAPYELYLAMADEDKVGYCLVVNDTKTNTMWLDYIAVFKQFHSKGFGSKIIKGLISSSKGLDGCFLEVEKEDVNEPDTIRRVAFYKKLGAVKSDCEYFYPNKEGCLAMDLYFLPFKTNIVVDKQTTKNAIQNVFEVLHSDLPHLEDVFLKIRYI